MLNVKKTLTKMLVPKAGVIAQVSDFITFNTGWSGSGFTSAKIGNLLFVELVIQKNNWAMNTTETVGTIKSEYVPILSCQMSGANAIGMVTSGVLYARNLTGSTTSTAQRICGVFILGGGYYLKVFSIFSRLAERWWEYAEYKENSHENLGEYERFGRNKVVFNTNNIVQYLLWSYTERCNPCRVYSNSTNKSINQSRIMRILRRWIRWEHGANWCSKILTKRNYNEFVWNIRSSVCTLRPNRLTISERGWSCA